MWKILYEINTPKDRGELKLTNDRRKEVRQRRKKEQTVKWDIQYLHVVHCTVSPHVEDTVRDQYSKG
jgi:hypothetical protein